jgi:hypothetical protein
VLAIAVGEEGPNTIQRGAGLHPGRQRLREDRRRRPRLARRAPRRLEDHLDPARGGVEPRRPVPRRGRGSHQHRRPAQRGVHRPGAPVRRRGLRQDSRGKRVRRGGGACPPSAGALVRPVAPRCSPAPRRPRRCPRRSWSRSLVR